MSEENLMKNMIEFQQSPDSNQKSELIAQITQLSENDSLTLRSSVSLQSLLEDLKRRRFQGMSWNVISEGPRYEVEVKKKDPGDCCGCCGDMS